MNLPVKVIILNNSALGMVRQWQESFYEETIFRIFILDMNPDFVKLAESFGVRGFESRERRRSRSCNSRNA